MHLITWFFLSIKNEKFIEKEYAKCSFPIAIDENKMNKNAIKYINNDAQNIVEELQPYKHKEDPTLHPLYILQQLSNIDKHRSIHTTSAKITGMSLQGPDFINWLNSGKITSIKGGISPSISGYFSDSNDMQKISNNFKSQIEICFNEAKLSQKSVKVTLQEIYNYVTDTIIPKLEPYL